MKTVGIIMLLLIIVLFYFRRNNYHYGIQQIDHSFISKLKNNEFVVIQYELNGCFSYDKDAITIRRIDDFFYLDRNTEKRKKLTQYDVEKLIRFECQLYDIPKGGCTTQEKYIITLNGDKKTFYDDTCKLQLWYKLTGRSLD